MKRRIINGSVLSIADSDDKILFSMEERVSGNSFIIRLKGDIQTEVAKDFEDEIMAILSVSKKSVCCNPVCDRVVCRRLVFDLSLVTYISSTALHTFLKYQNIVDNIEKGSMVICNPSQAVLDMLNETGFTDILDVVTDYDISEDENE